MKQTKLLAALLSSVLAASVLPVTAGESLSATNSTASTDVISSNLSKWWNGDSATANWFGIGSPLKDYGLTITGSAREVFLGELSGGLPNVNKGNWINEEKLAFIYDFAKVFGLKGLSMESDLSLIHI